MRSSTSSPIKRYQEVPVSDIDDGEEHDSNAQNSNTVVAVHDDLDDNDIRGSFHNSSISPSFSRMVGLSQYSRIVNSDASNSNNVTLEQKALNLNDDETNSLVLADASSPSSIRMNDNANRKGIFRDSPAASKNDGGTTGNNSAVSISRTPSGTASPPTGMNNHSSHDEGRETMGPTGLLSRQGSRCGASSTVSSVDWDDDEFDDDVVNIRRYHLEFGNGSLPQNQPHWPPRGNHSDDRSTPSAELGMNIIIDCFRCRVRQSLSTISYHWQSLRQAARQRRAARLLTMPSENARYKIRACVISWFCDATDIGIAFTASCVLIWIIVGVLTHNSTLNYWVVGTSLFIIRISARRSYDVCRSFIVSNIFVRRQQRQEQRGRLGSRQHLSSVDFDQNQNTDDGNSRTFPTQA